MRKSVWDMEKKHRTYRIDEDFLQELDGISKELGPDPMTVRVSCFDKSTYTFECLSELEDYAGAHNLDIEEMNFEMAEREYGRGDSIKIKLETDSFDFGSRGEVTVTYSFSDPDRYKVFKGKVDALFEHKKTGYWVFASIPMVVIGCIVAIVIWDVYAYVNSIVLPSAVQLLVVVAVSLASGLSSMPFARRIKRAFFQAMISASASGDRNQRNGPKDATFFHGEFSCPLLLALSATISAS